MLIKCTLVCTVLKFFVGCDSINIGWCTMQCRQYDHCEVDIICEIKFF